MYRPEKIIYIRDSLMGIAAQMDKIGMNKLKIYFTTAVEAINFFLDREAEEITVGNDYY